MDRRSRGGREGHAVKPEGQSTQGYVCPPDKIIYDEERGEYICIETGEVIEERVIDQGPEWRAFTSEEREKRSRTGSPISYTIHDGGLTTVIDWKDRDATGKRLSPKKRLEIMRWRKWQIRTRIQDSIDRNITQAAMELDRLSESLGLPKTVKEEAALIYRKAVEKGLIRGRSIESVVAAAIYIACRKYRIPRSLDEIASYTKAGRKDVARCYRLLLRDLGIKIPMSDPADYVPRIANVLGLSGDVIKSAIEILRKAREVGVTAGKDPAGLAAAAVYIAAQLYDERRTQKEVANVAGVTEVTVRNRYKELIKALNLQVPQQ
ncbi:MAG TPA: transcription initiation factor IIB [Acidilobales archaeon]|nr:MAG: transcription initiation factor IIB [Desulfurococcales archaeon ex4484_42]HDD25687.1 transcription initiation factor IIB [Acidilobales archaeon]